MRTRVPGIDFDISAAMLAGAEAAAMPISELMRQYDEMLAEDPPSGAARPFNEVTMRKLVFVWRYLELIEAPEEAAGSQAN